ncbi:multifunctional CCA tRNA nucleotidyl transferase/2'3'-cyclic phosphodiesterase/2'nucleotidase/phosphatase, partial [Pseudomonas sp. MWU13-2625]
ENRHRVMGMGAAALVRLFERSDALRKPARFAEMLQACESDARGRLGLEAQLYPQAERLRVALEAARGFYAGAIAGGIGNDTEKIRDAVHRARIEAVAQALEIGE